MISRRRLHSAKTLPRARGPWIQDSGGFTELSTYGRWQVSAKRYAAETQRCSREIGNLEFAVPQDWLCSPQVRAKTGLSVREHQERTAGNYLLLRDYAPDVSWMPVLQGWTADEYKQCVDLYDRAGVNLLAAERVGVGSLARRQHTTEVVTIIADLAQLGLQLHGFGIKTHGLYCLRPYLASADSASWSFQARKEPPLPRCRTHKHCGNCLRYALSWRDHLLSRPSQLPLFP